MLRWKLSTALEKEMSVSLLSSLETDLNTTTSSTTVPYSYTNIDFSAVSSSDKIFILYQAEKNNVSTPPLGALEYMSINSINMVPELFSPAQGRRGYVYIYSMEGSIVGTNSNSTVSFKAAPSNGWYRHSLQIIHVLNGAGITLQSSDITESTSQTSLSVTVLHDNGILLASGYISNGANHYFSSGIEVEYDGVSSPNNFGAGDSGVSTIPSGSTTVTYVRNGSTNNQGDALIAGVFY